MMDILIIVLLIIFFCVKNLVVFLSSSSYFSDPEAQSDGIDGSRKDIPRLWKSYPRKRGTSVKYTFTTAAPLKTQRACHQTPNWADEFVELPFLR